MSEDDEFQRMFPSLAKELRENKTQSFKIDGVRTMPEEPEVDVTPEKQTFLPNVVDYIRRCDTVNQAVEIIDFLLKQEEISSTDARAIKNQLRTEGLRSFGAKKEKDHYLHHGIE
ncbi:MAG: DUF2095 family protein [Candidatus Thorarchaeota archaeon]|nr:MAG: DUF2095 domain-containing protein [Candidatus Thorarchaeota archaeon]RLI59169.1 MAG: DUF2095 domain-containing protein [Candidatus Thorarchaeota archaeon]